MRETARSRGVARLAVGPRRVDGRSIGRAGDHGHDAGLSTEAREAWASSFLARLPQRAQRELLVATRESRLVTGAVLEPRASSIERRLEGGPCALVVSGLLRTFVSGGTRQVTLRYLAPGMVVGLPGIVSNVPAADAQAVTDSRVLRLPAATLVRLAEREPTVAWELCRFLGDCVYECVEILSGNVFLPVRDRVARHLLDLATQERGRMVVRSSIQDIADATGTVREVVSRVIRQLRDEGVVVREADAMVLTDTSALHRMSAGSGHGPSVIPMT